MKDFKNVGNIQKYPAKLAIAFLAAGLFLVACEKGQDSPASEKTGNLIINSDQSSLNQRVTLSDKIMRVESVDNDFYSTQSSKLVPDIDLSKNYVFRLKAEVDALVHEGNTLQATHVKIFDKYAFVTYNTKGNKYLGGVEIIDVSDINHPFIVRQFIFQNEDVSSVDYYNNKLYIVGALDIDADTLYNYIQQPAILEIISLNSGNDAKVDTIVGLDSYVGTDVRVTSGLIYTSTGSAGSLKVFDHTLNNVYSKSLADARAIEISNSSAYVLQGNPAQINRFNIENYTESGIIPVWNDPLQNEAKSELAISDKYIFAALNFGGMKMLNMDGSLKQWIPKPNTPEGKLDDNYVTNSVALNGDLVLFANGEAGLYLGGMMDSKEDSLALLGKIAFSDGESVNYVESMDSIIFVATGKGGLKILSIGIDEGLPPVIIETKPCPTLYDSIISYFPEYKNNFAKYPQIFNGNIPKQIKLTKESDVYVTFIHEGAGWKNSFGYYTYNEANPPISADALTKEILFPNVSGLGEGGALKSGNMVRVGTGKFPAGTVIGFYLIAQGWKNGLVTEGVYTHFTDTYLNLNNYQQHTLFKEKKCGDIVMIFEDITVNKSDKDFNDIMFVISDSSNPDKITDSFDLNGVPEF